LTCKARRSSSLARGRERSHHLAWQLNIPTIFSSVIITESAMSFIGLGFPLDLPTSGLLLYDGANFMGTSPSRVSWP